MPDVFLSENLNHLLRGRTRVSFPFRIVVAIFLIHAIPSTSNRIINSSHSICINAGDMIGCISHAS